MVFYRQEEFRCLLLATNRHAEQSVRLRVFEKCAKQILGQNTEIDLFQAVYTLLHRRSNHEHLLHNHVEGHWRVWQQYNYQLSKSSPKLSHPAFLAVQCQERAKVNDSFEKLLPQKHVEHSRCTDSDPHCISRINELRIHSSLLPRTEQSFRVDHKQPADF